MRSWNVVEGSSQITLLNGTGTVITKNKKVPFGVLTSLMSKMEELKFPIEYTDDLNLIHFTYLKNGLCGYYLDSEIKIACNNDSIDAIDETFIHEVGHYIDEDECYSSRDDFLEEWNSFKHAWEHDPDILRAIKEDDPSEYFAVGFSLYYTHPEQLCEKYNRALLRAIRDAENKRR